MTILFRKKGESWERAEETPYANEPHLQKMLYESPELIPMGEDTSPRIFIREAGLPGSGNTDLVGVDTNGGVYIVECKLASNPEVRRKVVGQVLEYAAFLWNMSYDDFNALFERREKTPLEDLIGSKAAEGWSVEIFRDKVKQHLSDGAFELVIVVDKINEDLKRIIKFVSSRGPQLRLRAIELPLYVGGDSEVVVPRTYGGESERDIKPPRPEKSMEESLAGYQKPAVRAKVESLVSEWQKGGGEVVPGRTVLSFRADIEGENEKIFGTFPSGHIQARIEWVKKRGAPQEAVRAYREKVVALAGFDRQKALTEDYPCGNLEQMGEGELAAFVRVSQELVERWRASRRGATS